MITARHYECIIAAAERFTSAAAAAVTDAVCPSGSQQEEDAAFKTRNVLISRHRSPGT